MERAIQLNHSDVRYTLKVSRRARRMRLTVYCGGAFVVTVPHDLPENKAERFIRQKASWILEKMEYFRHFKVYEFDRDDTDHFEKYKDKALQFIQNRIAHFRKHYSASYTAINIKNQKTRWGSCSKKGTLNFNYKLLFVPQELADYVIVHEMCHLYQFDHSYKFWNLVAQSLPQYRELKKVLQRSTIQLT